MDGEHAHSTSGIPRFRTRLPARCLEIWGDADTDEATLVRTAADLEALLERARGVAYPILLEVLDAASPNRVILNVVETGGQLPSQVEWQPWPTMASSS